MGRRALDIDIELLKATIKQVEAAGALSNRSELYNEVGRIMGVAHYNVGSRIEKLDIPVLTPKGARGRKKGEGIKKDLSYSRIPKRSKLSAAVKAALLSVTPKRYHHLIYKAEKSSKALVQLKCLECANYQPKEVKYCGDLTCATYSIRPYKTNEEKAEMRAYREAALKEINDKKALEDLVNSL